MAGHVKKDYPTAVYRFYSADGELLYVGVSMNLEGRLNSHKNWRERWQQFVRIELTWYPNRAEALAAETLAIETESPRWNATGSKVKAEFTPRSEYVADDLARIIREEPIPPGVRITVSEVRRIWKSWGVGYPSARQALRALVERGVVERRASGVLRC